MHSIGEGTFGEVVLATNSVFGKIAVKWLKVRCRPRCLLPKFARGCGNRIDFLLQDWQSSRLVRICARHIQSHLVSQEEQTALGLLTSLTRGTCSLESVQRNAVKLFSFSSGRQAVQTSSSPLHLSSGEGKGGSCI